jgi:hypothetical protein
MLSGREIAGPLIARDADTANQLATNCSPLPILMPLFA